MYLNDQGRGGKTIVPEIRVLGRYLNYFCRPISHRRSRIIQAVKHESKNTVDDNREYLYNRKRGLIEGYED